MQKRNENFIDGVSCTDINECLLNTHTCHQECINTEGSYECGCKEGYKKHGDACIGNYLLKVTNIILIFWSNLKFHNFI